MWRTRTTAGLDARKKSVRKYTRDIAPETQRIRLRVCSKNDPNVRSVRKKKCHLKVPVKLVLWQKKFQNVRYFGKNKKNQTRARKLKIREQTEMIFFFFYKLVELPPRWMLFVTESIIFSIIPGTLLCACNRIEFYLVVRAPFRATNYKPCCRIYETRENL